MCVLTVLPVCVTSTLVSQVIVQYGGRDSTMDWMGSIHVCDCPNGCEFIGYVHNVIDMYCD